MARPVVALTATTSIVDGLLRVRLNDAYVDAARTAGLTPLIVPPLPAGELAGVLSAVSGVILTGGEDVDPRHYGAAASDKTDAPHSARDECEIALARQAHERRIPTLAICRGIQVVNVAFGGTLVQDIPSECPAALDHDPDAARDARVHRVTFDADSALARVFGDLVIDVNSTHHQALARVADGVRVSGKSPDGIVEGAEWTADDWWMLGVQWHPEELVHDASPWDRQLFAEFARAVRGEPLASRG